MALVCYLLPLQFCLTYYVMFPESNAKTIYRDTSCEVIAQAFQIDEQAPARSSMLVGMLQM